MSTDIAATELPPPVSFWEAALYWLKLGFISFGGPAGQISMMHQELVEKRRWISEHRFLHALNYTMVLPGPEAQQLATYIGWLMHGVKGGIIAGVLFVLPSLFILITLSWIYLAYGDVTAVAGVLYGIKPAVIAIIAFAAFRIGSKALTNNVLRTMALAAFIAIYFFGIYFPVIVLVAAIFAYVGSTIQPKYFQAGAQHGSSKDSYGLAIIDDDTATPEHARFKWSRVVMYSTVGLAIGGSVMLMLISLYTWDGIYTQMSWFFTKAALVTFGGAYAVLPYVKDAGVDHYHWLSAGQMMDGLALGETTPGPLIMVVAFVGFIGGATQNLSSAGIDPLSGIIGASIATLFTFLPSFLFILVGGPAVEATRGDMKFTAPLTGITASVVGAILYLAVFFCEKTFWPQGFNESVSWFTNLIAIDWFSGLIALVAVVALFKFKVGIIKLIGVCALTGLAYYLLFPVAS
ncbi:Chromate transport protein ChrA [hydrothermal vent metagenome]|uniref:Chromate transport protein ChrA n=1 Tax=hydrothermal vent metagenome TaxID=652676 RepID=A0A3B0Z144_9ZZZZ